VPDRPGAYVFRWLCRPSKSVLVFLAWRIATVSGTWLALHRTTALLIVLQMAISKRTTNGEFFDSINADLSDIEFQQVYRHYLISYIWFWYLQHGNTAQKHFATVLLQREHLCEGGLGSGNSVCSFVRLSVTCVDCCWHCSRCQHCRMTSCLKCSADNCTMNFLDLGTVHSSHMISALAKRLLLVTVDTVILSALKTQTVCC